MHHRWTKSSITIVALAAVLALSGCGGGSDSGAKQPIAIGAWLPLTGPLATSGVPQRAGGDAYFKMLNAAGGINGRQVKWSVKDNAFDPQQTVQIARELVGQEKVVAIVNANGTPSTEATFPFVLQQSKVPIVNTYGGSESWYTPPRARLFGDVTLFEDQGAAVGAWAAEDGAKKLLVVHSDPAAFINIAKNVGPAAKKINPSVSIDTLAVKFQSTDYAPVIAQVKSRKPDAIVLILSAPEAAAYLKEAKLQNAQLPSYGYAPVASSSMLTLAGDAAVGFKAVQLVRSPNDDHPSVKEFRDAMAKYEPGQPLDFIALWGWMNAKLFSEIVKTIDGPVTAESITKAFESAKSIDIGVAPVMSFSENKHLGTREVQKVIVKDGAWISQGGFFTPPDRG